jgi:hypothetical protein
LQKSTIDDEWNKIGIKTKTSMKSLGNFQRLTSETLTNKLKKLNDTAPNEKPTKTYADGDGALELTIYRGILYKDTELFGKMDPYIEIKYNK